MKTLMNITNAKSFGTVEKALSFEFSRMYYQFI